MHLNFCLRDERKEERTKVLFCYYLSLTLIVRVFESRHPRSFLLDSLFDFSLLALKSSHLSYRYLKISYPTTRVIAHLFSRLTYLRVSLNWRKREEKEKKLCILMMLMLKKTLLFFLFSSFIFFFVFFFYNAHGQYE